MDWKERYKEDKTKLNNEGYYSFLYKSFKGLIFLNPLSGCLNGYVVIPLGHRLYRKYYDDINLEVHGGLTFSGDNFIQENGEYMIGFDTGHHKDLIPNWEYTHGPTETYRSFDYVKTEIEKMIEQIEGNMYD